jgi:hypothetical protein
MANFPNAFFHSSKPLPDWRDADDHDPDDELIDTPEDVVAMLGFDPMEFSDEPPPEKIGEDEDKDDEDEGGGQGDPDDEDWHPFIGLDEATFKESEHPRDSDGKFAPYQHSLGLQGESGKKLKEDLKDLKFEKAPKSKSGKYQYVSTLNDARIVVEPPSGGKFKGKPGSLPWSTNWTLYPFPNHPDPIKGKGNKDLSAALESLKKFNPKAEEKTKEEFNEMAQAWENEKKTKPTDFENYEDWQKNKPKELPKGESGEPETMDKVEGENNYAKVYQFGKTGNKYVQVFEKGTDKPVQGGPKKFESYAAAIQWANLITGKQPEKKPEPPKSKAPQASQSDIAKAKKTTPFYYPDGVPPSAQTFVDSYNKQYEGKALTDTDALNQKVVDYQTLKGLVDKYKAAEKAQQEALQSKSKSEQAAAQKAANKAAAEKLKSEQQANKAKNKEVMDALGITETEAVGFNSLLSMLGKSDSSDLIKQFQSYAEQAKKYDYPITGFQYALCRNYINGGYDSINKALRSGTMSQSQHVYTKMVNDALEKLPKYTGQVLRGTSLTPAQIANYKPGHVIEERAFTSTGVGFKFGGNVSYKIKAIGKRGGDFSHGANQPEKEVLFKAHTFFLVHKVETIGGRTYIEMEEVESHG